MTPREQLLAELELERHRPVPPRPDWASDWDEFRRRDLTRLLADRRRP